MEEKAVLITGCSTGIGLSTAQLLKARGFRVFATARKQRDVEKLISLGLESTTLDVSESFSIRNALSWVLTKTGGKLYGLFNNAGFAIPGAVEDLTRSMMRTQFETNVFGAIEMINLVLPTMRAQGFGRIIQNTSILGIVTLPYRGAYNASKFALEGFTNTLRQELHGTNIFVTTIAPGPILSEFRSNAQREYQQHIHEASSVHKHNYRKMIKYFTGTSSERQFTTLRPEAVAKKVLATLTVQHPPAHYYIGIVAKLFALLRRILPERLLDAIMIKINQEELKP